MDFASFQALEQKRLDLLDNYDRISKEVGDAHASFLKKITPALIERHNKVYNTQIGESEFRIGHVWRQHNQWMVSYQLVDHEMIIEFDVDLAEIQMPTAKDEGSAVGPLLALGGLAGAVLLLASKKAQGQKKKQVEVKKQAVAN